MTTPIVTSVTAENLHGRYNLSQNFHEGVNIIHGKNGSGKTTLLHILANTLNGNYDRFAYLDFDNIELVLNNETNIQIKKSRKYTYVYLSGKEIAKLNPREVIEREKERRKARDDYRRRDFIDAGEENEGKYKSVLPAAYFPAFRTMIEAWASQNRYPRYRGRADSNERKIIMTEFARSLFGPFVPDIIYSSILDIEAELERNIETAQIQVARKDRELLSESFLNILPALNPEVSVEDDENFKPSNLLRAIKKLLDELRASPFEYKPFASNTIYGQLSKTVREFPISSETQEGVASRILNLYRKLLEDRITEQREAFMDIEKYLDSVNEFLEDKEISVSEKYGHRSDASIVVTFTDGTESNLRTLSSGERQIVTLLYATTKMSKQEVVLIDEPEISLHVDWQRSLIKRMVSQLSNRQIITCTHSPVIGADYEKSKQELKIIQR